MSPTTRTPPAAPPPVRGDDARPAAPGARTADPHPAWLKEWRALRAEAAIAVDETARRRLQARSALLQRRLVETPAATRDGLVAQAELICDLAWNEVVRRAASQLAAGLRRQPE